MKSSIKKLILSSLLLCFLFSIQTFGQNNKASKQKASSSAMEAASQDYAEIVFKSLNAAKNFDFDAMHKDYAKDAILYWPDGDSDTGSSLKSKKEILAWWKNWQANSGVDKLEITNINLIPLHITKPLKYFKAEGTVVLAYFDSVQVYNGDAVKVKLHWAFSFNEDKKISKVYTYYDRSEIIKTAKANMIKKGAQGK